MKFISTRNHNYKVSLNEAVDKGLSPEGGLFVPERFPKLNEIFKEKTNSIDSSSPTFHSVAQHVLNPFLDDTFKPSDVKSLVEKAFDFPIPLKNIDQQTSVLELFHGPTAAFKDVGAQFMAQLMTQLNSGPKTILVATSGDTGGAVAAAFNGREGFNVVILFPKEGVSVLQKQQLTCWDKNIRSLAVNGTFDDCQRLVKGILSKKEWVDSYCLSTANSINIARLLPQSLYYAWSSMVLFSQTGKCANYIIPSGNLGNGVAAFWARKMGFPLGRIVLSTNANSVLSEFYQKGEFHPKHSQCTLANAMDVGNPSNFERLKNLIPDWQELKKGSETFSINNKEIKESIKSVYDRFNYLICPHTATAFSAFDKVEKGNEPWVLVSTAHPGKFRETVEPLIGEKVELPLSLQRLISKTSNYDVVEPNEDEILKKLKVLIK